MIFEFATLVTPRIINFRLAPASASLRLMRSLRIYYSMLWGALLQLTALYVWLSYTVLSQYYVRFSYTVLSQLCTFSSRILSSHNSVRSLFVYCPLTALYVLFSYTALSLHYVPFSQLCTFPSRILHYQKLRAQADMLWLNHKATDYQSFLVCL